MTYTATFAHFADGEGEFEFEVEVEGKSLESVQEYLDNCGDYDESILLSVEPNQSIVA